VISYTLNRKPRAIIWAVYTFSPSNQFKAVKRCAMNIAVDRRKDFFAVLLNIFERLPPCGV
jgi:hypothetical protein